MYLDHVSSASWDRDTMKINLQSNCLECHLCLANEFDSRNFSSPHAINKMMALALARFRVRHKGLTEIAYAMQSPELAFGMS